MGIEEVKKEIMSSAKAQAKEILKEGEKERQDILSSAETRVTAIKERLEKETEEAVEKYRLLAVAESTSSAKKQRLSMEKEMIDDVLSKAKEALGRLNQRKREQHLKKILEKAGKEISYGKVYCSKRDLSSIKKGKAVPADIIGGAILENADGSMRVDLSYETILDNLKQEHVSELAKILFKV